LLTRKKKRERRGDGIQAWKGGSWVYELQLRKSRARKETRGGGRGAFTLGKDKKPGI